MADVRSLLRQQRAARRVQHPHAAYSDAGKLLCTLCHEAIKSDTLWDAHVKAAGHRSRIIQAQASQDKSPVNGSTEDPSNKRKHDRTEEDEEMVDETEEEAVRRKRSRPDAETPATEDDSDSGPSMALRGPPEKTRRVSTPTITPPLARRTSGTPSQGVEMKIPSRPATPNPHALGGANGLQPDALSTPKATPVGRSPLIPQDAMMSMPSSVAAASGALQSALTAAPSGAKPVDDLDDPDWAAFEAEVINAPAKIAAPSAFSADAVISAAPLTAEELAARSEEEEKVRRRALADVQMEDEKEEASRALETEFEEMEQLEARVRRLKEKREALRQHNGTAPPATTNGGAPVGALPKPMAGKENQGAEEDAAEDEDDDEDEDDWVGFRFRG